MEGLSHGCHTMGPQAHPGNIMGGPLVPHPTTLSGVHAMTSTGTYHGHGNFSHHSPYALSPKITPMGNTNSTDRGRQESHVSNAPSALGSSFSNQLSREVLERNQRTYNGPFYQIQPPNQQQQQQQQQNGLQQLNDSLSELLPTNDDHGYPHPILHRPRRTLSRSSLCESSFNSPMESAPAFEDEVGVYHTVHGDRRKTIMASRRPDPFSKIIRRNPGDHHHSGSTMMPSLGEMSSKSSSMRSSTGFLNHHGKGDPTKSGLWGSSYGGALGGQVMQESPTELSEAIRLLDERHKMQMQELLVRMETLQREYSLERHQLSQHLLEAIRSQEVVPDVPGLPGLVLGNNPGLLPALGNVLPSGGSKDPNNGIIAGPDGRYYQYHMTPEGPALLPLSMVPTTSNAGAPM
ncbi:hypothetical protein TCAL_01667, partial [Tigriopus californicus]|eukprot:TCALIF_01667-PA protein Name:"Protein of unknown function" AED:0.14 eAED:0.14 QI:53/0.5/0/0.8/1/0.8/5/0/404